MERFAYARPGSLAEALELVTGATRLYAGGVDLLDLMKERLETPRRLVDLKEALDGRIEAVPEGVRIGAAATLAAVAASPLVARHWPAVAAAAAETATPAVRNVATVAGNLCQRPRCWYFRSREFTCFRRGGDTCWAQNGENRYHAVFGNDLCAVVHPSNLAPPLLAAGAVLEVARRRRGEVVREELPVAEFFVAPAEDVTREHVLEPGEVITAVRLPAGTEWRSAYLEIREKASHDWALASAAVALRREGRKVAAARVVLGHVAPVPWPLPAVAAFLRAKELTPAVAAAAGERAAAGARPLAQNAYKVHLVKVVVKRALLSAGGR